MTTGIQQAGSFAPKAECNGTDWKLFRNLTVSFVWCFLGLSMSVVVVFSLSVCRKQNQMTQTETAALLNNVKQKYAYAGAAC